MLATYADGNGLNCFPSVETLASDVGTDRRAVQRDLRALENQRLIKCVTTEAGRGKPRGYILNIDASKGHQIPLAMGGIVTAEPEDEKGGKSNISKEEKGRFQGGKRGGSTHVPIRSTSITSKNINPLQGEPPLKNIPQDCSEITLEISPEDLPSIAVARRVVEELCLHHDPGIIHAVAGAIDFCVKFEGKTKASSTEYLIGLARDEIARGGAPTRFWFTDRKWRNGNGNGKTQRNERTENDKNGTRAAAAVAVARFLRGENGMGDKNVSAAVGSKLGNTG